MSHARSVILPVLVTVASASAQVALPDPVINPSMPRYGPRDATYLYDDGAVNVRYRMTPTFIKANAETVLMHMFDTIPGAEVIESVQLAWGRVDEPVATRVAIWDDPNDDGDPTDAVLLTVYPVTVQNTMSNIINTYPLPSTVRVQGVFFVGLLVGYNTANFPYNFDTQPGYVPGRLWYASNEIPFIASNIAANTEPPVEWSTILGAQPGYAMIRARGVSSGITYQGELREAGLIAEGPVDLRFTLFSVAEGGAAVSPMVQALAVPLTDGTFTVELPFDGTLFNGSIRYLEIEVSPEGAGSFVTLAPRQRIRPAPAAYYAHATSWDGIDNIPEGFADGIDNDSGGDITAVTAGAGLLGGASSGNATLSVNFAGTGTATSVARSDHTTPWTSITGMPAGFADGIDNDSGGDITAVIAGTGLTGGASSGNATLNVNFAGTGTATTASRTDHYHNTLAASDGEPIAAVSVDATGRVGIGTTTPVSQLHLSTGSLWISGTHTGGLGAAAGAGLRLYNSTGYSSLFSYDYATSAAQPMILQSPGSFVGIGNLTVPQANLHVRQANLSIPTEALENDDLIVEAVDATLGLYSNNSGNWGSAIAMKEVVSGALVNTWGIARRTSTGSTPANALRFTFGTNKDYAANPYLMQIESNGNVGIGTTSVVVDAKLHVEALNDRVAKIDRYGSDGELLAWARNDTIVGVVSVASGVVTYGAFTGVHYARLEQPADPITLVSMTGRNSILGGKEQGETVYGVAPTARANDPAALGVYLASLPGETFDHPHDIAQIAAVGNTDVWIIDSGAGDIEPGDYLITSDTPGCAMKDNPAKFPTGHIFAIAAQRIDWSGVPAVGGVRKVKASVLLERFVRGVSAEEFLEMRRELDEIKALLGRR